MAEFKDRLREALRYKKMNQKELARRAGVAESQVSCYVRGIYKPNGETLAKIATIVGVSATWLTGESDLSVEDAVREFKEPTDFATVPIVGNVAAGTPILAEENIVGFVSVSDLKRGMFALKIKGDSMAPRIMDGDIVVIVPQDTAEDGDVVVARVEDDATCKVLKKSPWGITLVPFNTAFPPLVFSGEECSELHIVGKVVESRHYWR